MTNLRLSCCPLTPAPIEIGLVDGAGTILTLIEEAKAVPEGATITPLILDVLIVGLLGSALVSTRALVDA